jgi:hypothetical protein
MIKPRELQRFKITSVSGQTLNSKDITLTTSSTSGFQVGDEFIICGQFVPTRWERIKSWISRKTYPIKRPLLRAKWYLINVWDAICARDADDQA